MKKVLVIAYYWPPLGGGGVQRWLKFVKYLPAFGWQPVVFTPENPEFSPQDDTLEKDVAADLEVIRFPIWEPLSLYKKLFKSSARAAKQGIIIEKSRLSTADRVSIWIRANLFIPDPRRFWVNPSAAFLESVLRDNDIDVVVTTGPPHSVHLIGKRLKKKTGVQWMADFRDPWSDWDMLDKMKISSLARRIHQRMERQVMQQSDVLLTVSKRLAYELEAKGYAKNVQVVTNGVDEKDFDSVQTTKKAGKFSIVHTGVLNETKEPRSLWQVLEELCREIDGFQHDLEIVLGGMVSESILDRLRSSELLSDALNYLDYVSHRDVFNYYASAELLLLLLNQTENAKWILPGKMYEYMFAGKPILTLGEPESDARDMLRACEAGEVYPFDDKGSIKSFVLSVYAKYKKGARSECSKRSDKILKYSRKNLSKELAVILDEMAAATDRRLGE